MIIFCHRGPKIGKFGHLFNDMSSNRYVAVMIATSIFVPVDVAVTYAAVFPVVTVCCV